ncbi:hypothetical protein BGZ54_003522 [Gamsiella multidivaricata]|nr:hypothetical protein BGZ54_003522 [Gamsiella multidivaricata]
MHLLTGTLQADGHQLRSYAYSLTAQKKGRSKDEDSSESASQSSASCSTKPPKASKSNQQDVAGTSKASTESTGTKVKQLTEATLGPDELQKEFDDQESYVVLAIDPDIKSTAMAVIVDSPIPEESWNLSLSKGCHTWNSWRHETVKAPQKRQTN